MEEEFMDIRRELDKWEDIENHANSTPLQPRQLFHVDFVPNFNDPVNITRYYTRLGVNTGQTSTRNPAMVWVFSSDQYKKCYCNFSVLA